jgi:hypothetical protein
VLSRRGLDEGEDIKDALPTISVYIFHLEERRKAMIHIIRSRATQQQLSDMLQTLGTYIKLAVDIQRGILAGGGAMHADCEAILLEDGSQQEDVWGADWNPAARQVTFESLINIRPRQNNPSIEILDPVIQERVAQVARKLLGDV